MGSLNMQAIPSAALWTSTACWSGVGCGATVGAGAGVETATHWPDEQSTGTNGLLSELPPSGSQAARLATTNSDTTATTNRRKNLANMLGSFGDGEIYK